MKTLKNKYLIAFIGVMIALVSCESLDIENLNDPDFDTAFSNPSDIKAVAGGLIRRSFRALHSTDGPAFALWTASDAGTCSWGNFAMRDFGNEPRLEFNNKPSYGNAAISETFYNTLYSILSQSNDVLIQTINNGVEMENPAETPLVNAVAYFAQGITLGYVGLLYDKGFIVTHETDLSGDLEPSSYKEVINAAVASLDKCIALCNSNSFQIPSDWLPGDSYTSAEFGALANTFAARFLSYSARNKAENDATDWNKVYNYAKNGVQKDFAPLADDINWYSLYQTYTVYSGWGQVDMYLINLMDPNMPNQFPSDGDFSKLPNNGQATSDDARLLSDFQYLSSTSFAPERGYYHYSSYRYKRHDTYLTTWTEPMPEIRKAENDYLLAEAAAHNGNLAEAVSVLNASPRVTRGNLPPVGNSATEVFDAIHYERFVELTTSGPGIEYFQMRKSDLLQKGTILHFPIPGAQLEVMQMDYYTFGASTGVAGVDYSNGGWK